MFSTLFKKKVSEKKTAEYFIHNTIQAVDNSFDALCDVIEADSTFVSQPDMKSQGSDKMLIMVLAANMDIIPNHFESYKDRRITNFCYRALAASFDLPEKDIQTLISNTQKFLKSVNKPSKNTLYSLSKGVFYKYNLNNSQESYFKNMKNPNPILLKNLDEVMSRFLWDWSEITDKYNITQR